MRSFPSSLTIAEPSFPYMIAEENTKPTSFIIVRALDAYMAEEDFGLKDPTLFYIAGAELHSRDTPFGSEHRISLIHSFACDFDGSRSYVAALTVKSLQLAGSYGKNLNFTGWLTEVNFYPEGQEEHGDNPFAGAVKHAEKKGYENNLYPYLPPTIEFADSIKLPLEVSVSLNYNQKDVLKRLTDYASK
jgi:hypothetical protein